mgnify:CR=1 FL=1
MSDKTYVYFIWDRANNAVKIGCTKSPRRKVLELQYGNPNRLELVVAFEGGLDVEAALHQRFAASKIRGDWHEVTEELADLVAEIVRDRLMAKMATDFPAKRIEQSDARSGQRRKTQLLIEASAESTAEADAVPGLDVESDLKRALEKLLRANVLVAAHAMASNGLAVLARRLPMCGRYSWDELRAAQAKLIAEGEFVLVTLGPPSRRYTYIRLAADRWRYPGE